MGTAYSRRSLIAWVALALLAGCATPAPPLLCWVVERAQDQEKFMYCAPTTIKVTPP